MPIVNMLRNDATEFPEGAYCDLEWSKDREYVAFRRAIFCPACDLGRIKSEPEAEYDARCVVCKGTGETGRFAEGMEWTKVVVLWSSHVGLCINEIEENGRDDSDFFMIVWNPETKSAERRFFATTRGWSYPCLASAVDATPEVMAAYNAWRDEQARRARVLGRWSQRKYLRKIAAAAGMSYFAARRLRNAFHDREEWRRAEKLLTGNLRSGFRKSLRDQMTAWASQESPAYNFPLSTKQRQYL